MVLPFKADWENSWGLRLSEEGEHSLVLVWLMLNETSLSSSCGTFFIASPQISLQICPLVLWLSGDSQVERRLVGLLFVCVCAFVVVVVVTFI